MTTSASTAPDGAPLSNDFPELILALVRLLAREAARADLATLRTAAGMGGAK